MLVLLGRLGIFPMRAGSLYLAAGAARPARAGTAPADLTLAGAKRVFGIGDPLLLERRALELAQACAVPIEALEEALANWTGPERASGGVVRLHVTARHWPVRKRRSASAPSTSRRSVSTRLQAEGRERRGESLIHELEAAADSAANQLDVKTEFDQLICPSKSPLGDQEDGQQPPCGEAAAERREHHDG